VLALLIHLEIVPPLNPELGLIVTVDKLLKLPKTNLFPEVTFILPEIKIRLDLILTKFTFQITLVETEAVFVTSN
jgi:hypothetical protein